MARLFLPERGDSCMADSDLLDLLTFVIRLMSFLATIIFNIISISNNEKE